jgi:ABC-2 type transport system ATP-binding protein
VQGLNPTLKVRNVTKRFDDFVAVDNLSLEVSPGRIYGLLGPNGAGKTTTIRMVVNITAPDSGSVELFGQTMNPDLQNRVGYLPEERGLYKRMKVVDQLRFFGELKGLRASDALSRIDKWLKRVKLTEWRDKRTADLSKGMQQKVQFVAAVLHDPELIILDEPFSGLDPVNAELLTELVLDLKSQGKAIIFSTHQMEIAERICDDICLINRSKKVLSGTLREVKRGFGKNAVSLRVEGGDSILQSEPYASRLNPLSDSVEVGVDDSESAQELLRRLIESGATVSKFELIEPSLKEIFISKVAEAA